MAAHSEIDEFYAELDRLLELYGLGGAIPTGPNITTMAFTEDLVDMLKSRRWKFLSRSKPQA